MVVGEVRASGATTVMAPSPPAPTTSWRGVLGCSLLAGMQGLAPSNPGTTWYSVPSSGGGTRCFDGELVREAAGISTIGVCFSVGCKYVVRGLEHPYELKRILTPIQAKNIYVLQIIMQLDR